MASAIGDLVVRFGADTKGFQRGTSRVESRLGKMKSKALAAASAFGTLATAMGAAGLGLAARNAIRDASNMEEVMNKFNVVFGSNREAIKKWSDDTAKQMGRSKRQIAEFMSEAQDLFVPLGFGTEAATAMSKQITKLSLDLASFNNMADADVMRDLKAALTGSGEVMKKYGVIVSEAAVKQELMAQGMSKKQATAASDVAKVQARMNIILRGTTAAQGDVARSSGSYANQVKRLKGLLEDLSGEIGKTFLPAATWVVAQTGKLVTVFKFAQFGAIALAAGFGQLAKAMTFGMSDTVNAFADSLADAFKKAGQELDDYMNSANTASDTSGKFAANMGAIAAGAANAEEAMEKLKKSIKTWGDKTMNVYEAIKAKKAKLLSIGKPDYFESALLMLNDGADLSAIKQYIDISKKLDAAQAAAKGKKSGGGTRTIGGAASKGSSQAWSVIARNMGRENRKMMDSAKRREALLKDIKQNTTPTGDEQTELLVIPK